MSKTHQIKNSSLTAGYTIVEVMMVVAIISILASIAIPAYNGYIQNGKVTECLNEMEAIKLAEEEFSNVNLTYFAGAGVAALQAASSGTYTPSARALAANSNCSFTVVPGGSGIATSYTLTSTGQNELVALGVISTFNR